MWEFIDNIITFSTLFSKTCSIFHDNENLISTPIDLMIMNMQMTSNEVCNMCVWQDSIYNVCFKKEYNNTKTISFSLTKGGKQNEGNKRVICVRMIRKIDREKFIEKIGVRWSYFYIHHGPFIMNNKIFNLILNSDLSFLILKISFYLSIHI